VSVVCAILDANCVLLEAKIDPATKLLKLERAIEFGDDEREREGKEGDCSEGGENGNGLVTSFPTSH
jgi:hypothetical protein